MTDSWEKPLAAKIAFGTALSMIVYMKQQDPKSLKPSEIRLSRHWGCGDPCSSFRWRYHFQEHQADFP
jgi:hypothetical protein